MSKIIKASDMVLGQSSVTIASAPWSTAGWAETAATRAWDGDGEADDRWEERADEGNAEAEKVPADLPPEVAEARQAAAELVEQARQEAERIVAEAREQAEAALAQARAEGRAAGFEDGYRDGARQGEEAGRAKAEREMEAAVGQAMNVLDLAVHEQNRMIAASRAQVLKLIRKVAEKIIRAELRLDPEVVQRTVEAALRLVTERNQVLIRVNPEELAKAREGQPSYLKYFGTSSVVEICGDPAVTPGGCVIETAAGNLDARLETQLDEVMGELEDRLHGS
ncbi:MAG: FliH/SctL family protein [Chitinophagales bacterium]